MDIVWRVSIGEDARHAIETLVRGQCTLEDVVRWGLSCRPPRLIEDVIVQDEYTHDVILAHPADVWLVYDTT